MIQWIKLQPNHLELVMNWRMRPDITQGMYTDPVLTLEMQEKWYERIKDDPSQKYWIISKDGIPIGLSSLTGIDYVNKKCISGGYIAELEHRDFKSVMTNEYGMLKVTFDKLGLNRLQAEVLGNNMRVADMLKMNGYNVDGILRQAIQKNGVYYDVIILSYLREEWEAGKFRYKLDLEVEL